MRLRLMEARDRDREIKKIGNVNMLIETINY